MTDPLPTTDAELDRLRAAKGVRDNQTFLETDYLPHFFTVVMDRVRLADNTEDLLRAQGALRIVSEQAQYIKNKLKPQKGVVT